LRIWGIRSSSDETGVTRSKPEEWRKNVMKAKEIRAMSPDERVAKLHELMDELMHERGVKAMGGAPTSSGKIRSLRRDIARIKTVLK